MRVIAGKYRSRLLSAPAGVQTRPTSDRLRETLFNIIAPRLPGCRFADLYAGTGAVGIEAISRGAEHVFFAENAPPTLKALRQNLEKLGIHHGFAIEDRGVSRLLTRLTTVNQALDFVFLDPPYEDEAAYTSTFTFFASEIGRKTLAPGAVVIAEHATRGAFTLPAQVGALAAFRTLKQGDSSLTFFAGPSTNEV